MKRENNIILHRLSKNGSGIEAGQWSGDASDSGAYLLHRHDHYTCMLLDEGEIEVLLDFQHRTMPARTLFVSYPGQVHQVISSRDASGWYLSFDDKLVELAIRNTLDRSLEEMVSVELTAKEYLWFKGLIGSMTGLQEISSGPRQQVQQALLSAFITQAMTVYRSGDLDNGPHGSARQFEIIRDFRDLVRKNFRSMKKPAEYADKMNVTVAYLNDTVKLATGSSISEIIQQEIVGEAKRLLCYTSLSVKEVATAIGYDDYKYFTRFFGKKTGIPPAAFRNWAAQNDTVTSTRY